MRLPNRCLELKAQGFQIDGRTEPNGCKRYFLRGEPEKPKPLPTYAQRTRAIEAEVAPLFAGMRP